MFLIHWSHFRQPLKSHTWSYHNFTPISHLSSGEPRLSHLLLKPVHISHLVKSSFRLSQSFFVLLNYHTCVYYHVIYHTCHYVQFISCTMANFYWCCRIDIKIAHKIMWQWQKSMAVESSVTFWSNTSTKCDTWTRI